MPQAGWYSDPKDAQQLRYWDGGRWTTSTRSAESTLTATPTSAAVQVVTLARSPQATETPLGGPTPRLGAQMPATAASSIGGRRRLALAGAAAILLVTVVVGGRALIGGHGSQIKPVPDADQAYVRAAHADLPNDNTTNSKLLAFGHVVCGTYSQGDSPKQRLEAIDRPDLVSNAASRTQLFGEALTHLCPEYQLKGIQPPPAAPGSKQPASSTTAPGPSISVFSS